MTSSPMSGSELTAWNLLGILSLPLSAPSCSRSLPTPTPVEINKQTFKKRKKRSLWLLVRMQPIHDNSIGREQEGINTLTSLLSTSHLLLVSPCGQGQREAREQGVIHAVWCGSASRLQGSLGWRRVGNRLEGQMEAMQKHLPECHQQLSMEREVKDDFCLLFFLVL